MKGKRIALCVLSTLSLAAAACSSTTATNHSGDHGGGKTSGPIKLAWIVSDFTGVDKATGNKTDNPARDNQAAVSEMHALVDWANSTGGVGGRKIVAASYKLDLLDTDTQNLAACSKITEDDGQQVVIDDASFTDEAMWSCFASHHVDFVGNESSTSTGFLKSVAPYIAGVNPPVDVQMANEAAGLSKTGFLKSGKLGVALEQIPVLQKTYKQVLAPALKSMGLSPVVKEFAHNDKTTTANAALALKAAHVDHILFFGNIIDWLDMTGASSSQHYFPAIAFTDYQAMPFVAGQNGSPQINAGAVAVSSLDGDGGVANDASRSTSDTTSPFTKSQITPGFNACNAILSKQLHVNYTNPGAAGASTHQQTYCDNFMLWLDAARKVGSSYSPDKFQQGLTALRTSYSSSIAHSTNFANGNAGGAGDYRVGNYTVSCRCFVASTSFMTTNH